MFAQRTHLDLIRDLGGHVLHVRDHPDRPARAAQCLQLRHHQRERVRVKGPEALVDEHCAQFNASGLGRHDVREAEGQGEGGVEGLPTRQGPGAAHRVRVVVDDRQPQAGFA